MASARSLSAMSSKICPRAVFSSLMAAIKAFAWACNCIFFACRACCWLCRASETSSFIASRAVRCPRMFVRCAFATMGFSRALSFSVTMLRVFCVSAIFWSVNLPCFASSCLSSSVCSILAPISVCVVLNASAIAAWTLSSRSAVCCHRSFVACSALIAASMFLKVAFCLSRSWARPAVSGLSRGVPRISGTTIFIDMLFRL
mmetsp:Transcript_15464/g.42675  ORF Transcript_15464/g.42675 Transcript_15464/m.42675 type:complete len:202 (+) Transcript_15464:283-888(+)